MTKPKPSIAHRWMAAAVCVSAISVFAPARADAACADPAATPQLNLAAVECMMGQPCAIAIELIPDDAPENGVKTTSAKLESDKPIACSVCEVEAPAGYGDCNFNAGTCAFFLGDAFDPVDEFSAGTIATLTLTCDEAGIHDLDLSEVSFGASSGIPINGCGQAATIHCNSTCEGVDCSHLDDVCVIGTCDEATGTCTTTPRADGTVCSDGSACTTPDECEAGVCTGPDICPSGEFCDGSSGACVTVDLAAFMQVTLNQGIDASTYGSGSMRLRNDASNGVKITRAVIDISDVLLPDIVFDPDGSAGDITAKCLEPGSGAVDTGFVAPGDPCTDPFSSPFDNGYFVMEINFTDFEPGEQFNFAVDIDPTTIQGATKDGGAGSVSGLELSGAVITVDFDNGASLTGELFRNATSLGGGRILIKDNAPSAPTISFVGIPSPPQSVSNASQTVRVSGAGANRAIRLLHIDAELDLLGTGGHDVDPFEGNSAVQVFEYSATTNGSGTVDIPVTLARLDADAGYNYFRAVEVSNDGSGRTGGNSNVIELRLEAECTQNSECDDGNPCTDDVCDMVNGCENTNNADACDDGQFCNGNDTCNNGSCSIHAGDPCAAGGECADSCNESANDCNVAAGTACTDDGNPCTTNQCDGDGNCASTNNTAPCDDGAFCTATDTCSGGVCSGAGDPCAGGGECADACDESADTCNDPAGTACTDDGNPCTTDACDGGGDCVASNNASSCDDGDACTTGESCTDGSCGGGSAVICDDGLFCNGVEGCDAEAGCLSGDPPLDCSNLDSVCAVGSCDEESEQCLAQAANEGGACDDADVCTFDDACASGACTGLPLCDPACEACTEQGECLPLCGHPASDPSGQIVATDALYVLNAAVGALQCLLCVCDVDASGAVVATDALRTLAKATGLGDILECPDGAEPAFVYIDDETDGGTIADDESTPR